VLPVSHRCAISPAAFCDGAAGAAAGAFPACIRLLASRTTDAAGDDAFFAGWRGGRATAGAPNTPAVVFSRSLPGAAAAHLGTGELQIPFRASATLVGPQPARRQRCRCRVLATHSGWALPSPFPVPVLLFYAYLGFGVAASAVGACLLFCPWHGGYCLDVYDGWLFADVGGFSLPRCASCCSCLPAKGGRWTCLTAALVHGTRYTGFAARLTSSWFSLPGAASITLNTVFQRYTVGWRQRQTVGAALVV